MVCTKFTTNGVIRFSSEPFGGEGRKGVRFTVSDTGIGMTPAEAESVFQPFRRAMDGGTSKSSATVDAGIHDARTVRGAA